jgi:TonB family protein
MIGSGHDLRIRLKTRAGWVSAFCTAQLLFGGIAHAQITDSTFPDELVIARDTFWDFGPPFNYYEILSVEPAGAGLSVERILVTPAGDRCLQPPTVEVTKAKIDKSIKELLQGQNPCNVPEKALRKERDRRKKSVVFSGVNVTMQVSCGTRVRDLRMDILDRDIYAKDPKTPRQTSWTMSVLDQLDKALGPGVPDKPIFNLKETDPVPAKPPESETIRALRDGQFDSLFGSSVKVSDIYRQALEPRRLPNVVFGGSSPDVPVSFTMPKYPPIARAAHVEGTVTFTLDVASGGRVTNLSYVSGPKLLWNPAATDVINGWEFRPDAIGHHVQASIAYRLNCPTTDIKKD